MLENIQKAIHQSLNELCAEAYADELTGDTESLQAKLETVARIAEALGIKTKVTTVTISLLQ